ncbi:MAG: hypothetical protein RL637_548 [Pseudomonadota bacterium]|jgi:heptosyltransferase-3
MRYLGDTLLVTPLISALKNAFPQAKIDVLTFKKNESIFEGNFDIHQIISIPQKLNWKQQFQLFKKIFRKYNFSVITQTGDRPILYGLLAAPIQFGFVPIKNQTGWFKRYLLTNFLEFDTVKTHTVLENLRLCELLSIEKYYHVTLPKIKQSINLKQFVHYQSQKYVVLHPVAQWNYKRWATEGWIEIIKYLDYQGFKIVFSGSSLISEIEYLNQLQSAIPIETINLAGLLSLAELAELISRAKLYIGVDTGISHLAAATGVKTVVLFGPSDPVKWAPWPTNYTKNVSPFMSKGTQTVNNVTLIQHSLACVPCYLEGCDRHRQSESDCLQQLPAEIVKQVITKILCCE